MKQILLLRHAKSSWDNPDLQDFDRPLAKRGLNDAPRMGRYLRKCGYKPNAVISSPAERARQTSLMVLEGAKIDEGVISWKEDLYFGSVEDYVEAVNSVSEEAERVMLVGHNPLMESCAGTLAGAATKVAIRMPTAALVCLESFANKWSDIRPGTCQVKWMMIPKVLKEIMD